MPFTPNSELDLLFDDKLVRQASFDALAQRGLHLRPLSSTDYSRGHLDVLADLTSTPDIGLSVYQERFNLMKSAGTYYILVVIDKETDQVVATGTNMAEYKFIRNAGVIGHIEDIAVSSKKQGQRLGYYIVTALTELGEKVGFYKSILDCDEKNRGFYEKCGHEYKGIQMAKYGPSYKKT